MGFGITPRTAWNEPFFQSSYDGYDYRYPKYTLDPLTEKPTQTPTQTNAPLQCIFLEPAAALAFFNGEKPSTPKRSYPASELPADNLLSNAPRGKRQKPNSPSISGDALHNSVPAEQARVVQELENFIPRTAEKRTYSALRRETTDTVYEKIESLLIEWVLLHLATTDVIAANTQKAILEAMNATFDVHFTKDTLRVLLIKGQIADKNARIALAIEKGYLEPSETKKLTPKKQPNVDLTTIRQYGDLLKINDNYKRGLQSIATQYNISPTKLSKIFSRYRLYSPENRKMLKDMLVEENDNADIPPSLERFYQEYCH